MYSKFVLPNCTLFNHIQKWVRKWPVTVDCFQLCVSRKRWVEEYSVVQLIHEPWWIRFNHWRVGQYVVLNMRQLARFAGFPWKSANCQIEFPVICFACMLFTHHLHVCVAIVFMWMSEFSLYMQWVHPARALSHTCGEVLKVGWVQLCTYICIVSRGYEFLYVYIVS